MNPSLFLYNAAMVPAGALASLASLTARFLPGEKGAEWRQRLGCYTSELGQRPGRGLRLWIHAVSVGEVGVAAALVAALDRVRPDVDIVLSTMTPQGQELARGRFATRVHPIYFPLDFLGPVRRAFRHFRPDLVVCLETELWPNFLGEAQRLGIPIVLLNGRISARSFPHYRRLRWLLAPLLRGFAGLAMISAADAERIIAMGAPAERVAVTGNMKGAGLLDRAELHRVETLRQRLNIASDQPVLVAGSIRDRELTWLPEIFVELTRERPELMAIFAPRHLNRLGRLEEWFRRQGLPFHRYSRLADGREARRAAVILVDRVGDLFDLYGVGDLTFCGGSLVPLGGQNILEPAAWGKAVFYGPHMENFLEERRLLEEGGCGISVGSRDELLERMGHHLSHLEELRVTGGKARAALQDRDRIAVRQAELVRDVLNGRKLEAWPLLRFEG
ncbi:MAG TPA: glycosyltransferase N-terminal domain-containing protein [Syntrophobacteria bacterium]|nr:glycosyltransferase N-terminal domain-containing protein [Syntrophobacteria bacterium]